MGSQAKVFPSSLLEASWFARSAQWTVFIARFVPGLKTAISLPAGLFEVNLFRFIVMTLEGCFAWSVILIYAGVFAGSAGESNLGESPEATCPIAAVFAIVAAYMGCYFYSQARSSKANPDLPSSES